MLKEHGHVEYRDGKWFIGDHSSKYGTFVNDTMVKSQALPIKTGDHVGFILDRRVSIDSDEHTTMNKLRVKLKNVLVWLRVEANPSELVLTPALAPVFEGVGRDAEEVVVEPFNSPLPSSSLCSGHYKVDTCATSLFSELTEDGGDECGADSNVLLKYDGDDFCQEGEDVEVIEIDDCDEDGDYDEDDDDDHEPYDAGDHEDEYDPEEWNESQDVQDITREQIKLQPEPTPELEADRLEENTNIADEGDADPGADIQSVEMASVSAAAAVPIDFFSLTHLLDDSVDDISDVPLESSINNPTCSYLVPLQDWLDADDDTYVEDKFYPKLALVAVSPESLQSSITSRKRRREACDDDFVAKRPRAQQTRTWKRAVLGEVGRGLFYITGTIVALGVYGHSLKQQ